MRIRESHILISVLLLSMAGMGLATYLVANHYQYVGVEFCRIGTDFSCQEVNTGNYSYVRLLGMQIPWSVIGLTGFVVIFVLAYLRLYYTNLDRKNRFIPLIVLFSVVGAILVVYLNYLELAVIHEICLLCATSHVLMIVILILSVWWQFLGRHGETVAETGADITRTPDDAE